MSTDDPVNPYAASKEELERYNLERRLADLLYEALEEREFAGGKEPQPVPERVVKPLLPPAPPIPQARPALSTLVSPIFHPARFLPSTSINYMIQLQAAAESEHSLESFALDVAATAQKLGFQVTIKKG